MGANPKEKPVSVLREDGTRKKKIEIIDDSIQGTNDSSISSKRSVESLYKSKGSTDIEFFKFFVPKRQRRSPNINRGYWTRMEAIDKSILHFAQSNFKGRKVVVNLGCGFDPYAFQYLHKNPGSELIFVDVDYPDLMNRKLKIVDAHSVLSDAIGPERTKDKENGILLKTPKYVALSCDLRKLETFSKVLNSLFPFEASSFLFVAEVSLTYMVQKSADNLIEWAGSLPNARFALLEQIIPATEHHPFARRMLNHFRNYGSPLNSVELYPNLDDQIDRFKCRGWSKVHARDLTDFWYNEVSDEQKKFVRSVEDFDEWEEFIIFGQHYFILDAVNDGSGDSLGNLLNRKVDVKLEFADQQIWQKYLSFPEFNRKFSAGCLYNDQLLMNGGMGDSRKQTTAVLPSYGKDSISLAGNTAPPARMGHTMTHLSSGEVLLVGGRSSPSKAFTDCWILRNCEWVQVQGLPAPRFRHCTVALTDSRALVYGGLTSDESPSWLVWSHAEGWKELEEQDNALGNRSSSTLSWNEDQNFGILVGGMEKTGRIQNDAYRIELKENGIMATKIVESNLLTRLGAKSAFLNSNTLLIAGGVSDKQLYNSDDMLIELSIDGGEVSCLKLPEPMLLNGFCMDKIDNDSFVIYGGGAVCYSFGSHWNGVWILSFDGKQKIEALGHKFGKAYEC